MSIYTESEIRGSHLTSTLNMEAAHSSETLVNTFKIHKMIIDTHAEHLL
jgi:hypothetical protein